MILAAGVAGAELGPLAENHRRHGATGDLLGTHMREAVEVSRQPAGDHQGKGRHRRLAFTIFAKHLALDRHVLRAGEAADRKLRVVRPGRTHAEVGGKFGRFFRPVLELHRERERCRTQPGGSTTLGLQAIDGNAFLALTDRQGLGIDANNLEMRRGFQRDGYWRPLTRARNVIGHTHRDFELIARRHCQRRIRRQNKITLHDGLVRQRADRLVVHRHRHQAQGAVEGIGHGVAELALATHIDNARPVHRRLVALALEGVEILAQCALGIATGGCRLHQFLELGQDQVEDLRSAHIKRTLLEKMRQRVGHLVASHLQDAFVDREHHRTGGLCRTQFNFQDFTRFDLGRRIETELVAALFQVHRKRYRAVRQGAHENFIRTRIANVLHCHIAIALEIGRQTNFLHRGLRRGLEPLMRIDLVALDGDEAGAGIGRANADFDVITGGDVLVLQRQLQLGIAVQRARDIAGARHRIFDAVLLDTFGIANAVEEIAGRIGGQRQVEAADRDRQRAFLDLDFLGLGFVFVGAIRLLHQHRDKAALDQFLLQILHRRLLRFRINRQQIHQALRATRYIGQIAIRLEADQKWQLGNHRCRIGRHAAPALGFEGTRQEMQAIRGFGIASKIEIKLGIALFVGGRFGQLVRIALLGAQRIVEAMIGIAAERGVGGLQGQGCFNASIGGRRAKQVLRIHLGLQFTG